MSPKRKPDVTRLAVMTTGAPCALIGAIACPLLALAARWWWYKKIRPRSIHRARIRARELGEREHVGSGIADLMKLRRDL